MQEVSTVLSGFSVSDLPLNDLREQYIGGQINRKEFEGHIFEFLLDHYKRFHLFGHDRDAFTDYLCWLYPRLSRAIDAYKEVGASFDAYIGSIVRWSSKSIGRGQPIITLLSALAGKPALWKILSQASIHPRISRTKALSL